MTRILLAVDETEASEQAARFTERLFGGRDVEVIAVDLIVVGSGDKGLIQRWFGKSVSDRLTRELPRPVLVVGGAADTAP